MDREQQQCDWQVPAQRHEFPSSKALTMIGVKLPCNVSAHAEAESDTFPDSELSIFFSGIKSCGEERVRVQRASMARMPVRVH